MRAMRITRITSLRHDTAPLEPAEVPRPRPGEREILVRVSACGVCHTELDEIEGRTAPPRLPMIPGHQVVGSVVELGDTVSATTIGDRVGVGWIYSACGQCEYCRSSRENLCPSFTATGRDADGGYAEFMKVPEEFAIPIPERISDPQAAPLLCAGAVGYRSLLLAGMEDGQLLGLTGFGASGHLVLKMAKALYPACGVFVFARSAGEREFAMQLGAAWSGDPADVPPAKLHSIIDTTPAWKPAVESLKNLKAGGRLVINAIRKEDLDREHLLRIDYSRDIWMEKEIKSVANVTRSDIRECLALAARIGLRPEFQEYALEDANRALRELKEQKIRGAKVLRIG